MARYIDADELIKVALGSTEDDTIFLPDFIDTINERPTADVRENVKGKWIPIQKGERGYSAGDFRCSICHQPNNCYTLTAFCSSCGADMRGEHEQ